MFNFLSLIFSDDSITDVNIDGTPTIAAATCSTINPAF